MDRKRQNKKNKLNKKSFVMYIFLIIGIYTCYTAFLVVKKPTNTFTIEEGEVYQEETDIGYVIRNEKIVKGENYANGMEKIKTEGEKTAKEESIFRYYSKNEEKLKEQIADLDFKIQEVMASETGIYSSDMKLIENQIDEKIDQIRYTVDMSKLEEDKKEINDLVTKKAKIAGDLSPKGSYLNQLIGERSKYEAELNSGAEYIKAPDSGIVSYRVDGLEDKLTPNNFSELNEEYLEKLDLKTGKIVATSEEEGKIIDSFSCYIATISNSEEARNAKVGDKVTIRLSNNVEVDAEVVHVAEQGKKNNVLIVLQFNEQISELTNYRKISFDLIWWKYKGLKIPNQAIFKENNLDYVMRNKAGYMDKTLVKVTKQNKDYSIITSYSADELRQLGYTEEQINSYKKISLYDEILLNPRVNNQ